MWSPHRFRFWTGSLLLLAGLAGGHAEVRVGEIFPSLDSVALEGGTPPATAGKVTLVDFWASWCAPCKVSFPVYARLDADYRDRGLVIVAVSVDENPAKFTAFVKRETPPFATLRDKSLQLVSRVKAPAMPTCYLLDRDGRVRFMHQGFRGAETDRQIRRQIESLIAEPYPPS